MDGYVLINLDDLENRVFAKLIDKGYNPTSKETQDVVKTVLLALDELYLEQIEQDLEEDSMDEDCF